MHTMVDIETLSTRQDALVLSIAAVRFEFNNVPANEPPMFDAEILLLPSIIEQIWRGRHVDMETVKWWNDLPPEASAHWRTGGQKPINYCMDTLNDFAAGSKAVWAHGTDFDIGILRSLYGMSEYKEPWKYNATRDARTVYRVMPKLRSMPADLTFVKHEPLDDCRHQIWRLWERSKTIDDVADSL